MDEEQKYLQEKHNRGVIINDDNEDWGGCPSTYEKEKEEQNSSLPYIGASYWTRTSTH